MKTILSLLLLFSPVIIFAQDSVILKVMYKPERVYTTDVRSLSDVVIDIEGDQASIDKINSGGMKFPMSMKGETTNTSVTKTGKADSTGSMPYVVEYVKAHISMNGMGMQIEKESPIASMKMFGSYSSDGKATIDSIANMPAGSTSKDALLAAMNKMQQSIRFPGRALRVGDTFTQNIPLEVPVAGMKPLSMNITGTYTVKSIADGLANLDIALVIKMETENEEYHLTAEGAGKGNSDFDIANSILRSYTTDLNMTMKLEMKEITMVMKMTSRMDQTVTVGQ